MHVERARIACVIGIPNFFKQGVAFHNFTVFVHKDLEQQDKPGGELGAPTQAFHTAMFNIQP
jgi:hypothetical protein